MARLIFPSAEDRLVYGSTVVNQPLISKRNIKVKIYTDAAATVLADIQTTAGVTIAGSELTVDDNSLLPFFKGPDTGVDTLYAVPAGGQAVTIYARYDDRLDTLEGRVLRPEKYGAILDGVADDTAAWNAVIAAATSKDEILATGKTKISSTLTISKTIKLGGSGPTRWTTDNSDPEAGLEFIYTGTSGDAIFVQPPNATNSRISPYLHDFLIRGNKAVVGATGGGGIKLDGRASIAGTAISGFALENVHVSDSKGIGLAITGDVYEGRYLGVSTTDCGGDGIDISLGGGQPGESVWINTNSHDNGGNGIDCNGGSGWSWIRISSSRNVGSSFKMTGCQFRVWDLQCESNQGSKIVHLDSIISGIIIGLNIDYLEPSYVGTGVSIENNSRQVTLITSEFSGTATTWDILTDATTESLVCLNYRQSAANKTSLSGLNDVVISGGTHYGVSEFTPKSTSTSAVRYRNLVGQVEDIYQQLDAAGSTVYSRITATGGYRCRDDLVAQHTLGGQTVIGAVGPTGQPGLQMGDAVLYRHLANVMGTQADDCFKTGQAVTASRPSAVTVGVGSQFFDTTLNKPIWSDGAVWRDAAGTAV